MKHIKEIFEGLFDDNFDVDHKDLIPRSVLESCVANFDVYEVDGNVLNLRINDYSAAWRPCILNTDELLRRGINTIRVHGRHSMECNCYVRNMTLDMPGVNLQVMQGIEKSHIICETIYSWGKFNIKGSTIEAEELQLGQKPNFDSGSKFLVKTFSDFDGYSKVPKMLGINLPHRMSPLTNKLIKLEEDDPDQFSTMFSGCNIVSKCGLRANQWPDLQKIILYDDTGRHGMIAVNINKQGKFVRSNPVLKQPIKLKNGWIAHIFPNI